MLSDIWRFLADLLDNWAAFMTGGIPVAVLALWERWQQRPISFRRFAAIFLLFGFAAASFQTWRQEHAERVAADGRASKADQGTPSPYKWAMLTSEEVVALRGKIRDIKPGSVSVSCAEDDCGDLARNFRDVFAGLHWEVMCCSYPFGSFDPGIHLWAENPELKGVARDIEQATNGRLKVDMAEHFTWDVQKYPLQITIGSKPSS